MGVLDSLRPRRVGQETCLAVIKRFGRGSDAMLCWPVSSEGGPDFGALGDDGDNGRE